MMFEQHEDYRPVTWVRGHPLYAAHVIVLAYVVTMIISTAIGPGGVAFLAEWLGLESNLVHDGQVWRILTYGLVNPPSISFVIDMFVIAWFGTETERFLGRRTFLKFYAALYLLTPVVFTLLGFFRPMSLIGETGGFALFISFATIYPGAVLIFNILAKWLAVIAVGIYTLTCLYARDFVILTSLWITVGFAFGFVRYQQGRIQLPSLRVSLFRRRPKLRVLPRPSGRDALRATRPAPEAEVEEEMDTLLDKIARNGIGSLTESERSKLEKAREELLKKDRK